MFKIISTQMMDVSLGEIAINNILIKQLFDDDSYNYRFTDSQFVKRLLNQLKALNLVYSSWIEKKSALFWGLTSKGELTRNRMILSRNTPLNEEML